MANVPTTSWDETAPDGSQAMSLGDNRIRELKTQLREIIGVDHNMDSSGQDTDWGQHKQVTLQEQADLGTGAEGATILGSQTADGKGELTYTDEDDNDIQITDGGRINAVQRTGDETIAGEKTFSTFPISPSAAPDADYEFSNKKYVDDEIAGITSFTSGMIILWSGTIANIPTGWVLCNGANSTPDLRKRFVIGADSENGAGTGVGVGNKNSARISGTDNSLQILSGSNAKADGGGTCTAQNVNMIPDYYALAYIMKS